MNEQETFETSVVTMEESPAAEGATIPAEETGAEPRIPPLYLSQRTGMMI